MPGSGNWCVLQDVALFAGAVRVQNTVGQGYLINGVGNATQQIIAIPALHYVLKLSPARKDKQLL